MAKLNKTIINDLNREGERVGEQITGTIQLEIAAAFVESIGIHRSPVALERREIVSVKSLTPVRIEHTAQHK